MRPSLNTPRAAPTQAAATGTRRSGPWAKAGAVVFAFFLIKGLLWLLIPALLALWALR